jgi:translocation and assembly module TamA
VYASAGRLVRVDRVELLRVGDSGTLNIDLAEGPAIQFDSLAITGLSPAQAGGLRALVPVSHAASDDVIDEQLGRMARGLANTGQPFAALSMRGVSVDSSGRATMLVDVDAGDSVTVQGVEAIGRTETTAEVITRASGVPHGSLYRESEAERVRGRLDRLGVFRSVGNLQLVLRAPREVILRVPVTEVPSSIFDAIVGYVPGAAGERGFAVGMVNVQFGNLFGSARRLTAAWERRQRDAQHIAIGYHEPWLLGLPLAFDAHVQQHEQDSSYTRRGINAGVTIDNIDAFSITGSIGYASTVKGSPTSPFQSSSELTAGFRVVYDTRDDADCPRGGAQYSTRYRVGTKRIAATGESQPIQIVDVHADLFLPLARNTVIAAAVHGGSVISSLIDVSDLMRIGGVHSVRGYREDQFLAARVLWGGGEVRQIVGGRSYVFAFIDGGYRVRAAIVGDLQVQEGFLIGYGAGIQTDSPIGLVKVSAAANINEGFAAMKIHVGIVERF